MRARRMPAAAGAAALALAACTFGERAVGIGREEPVVHAVLDPGRTVQTVLLERTLGGRVDVDPDAPPDPNDPVASGGGVPISGATVVVYGPEGDSVVLVEAATVRGDGTGRGVYQFHNLAAPTGDPARPTLPVRPGGRYALRIETPEREVVTAATTIPGIQPMAPGSATVRQFDRDRDSLFLSWGEIPSARRYALRIESPRGPFRLFVDSLEYLIAGSLRNPDVDGVPRVFSPGFQQVVTLGAVDGNYHDYYRSGSSPLTGSGLIEHVAGGTGLFGSYVLMRMYRLDVVAGQEEPIEGPWLRERPATGSLPAGMELYEDARGATVVQLSGRYYTSATSDFAGVLGVMDRVQGRLTIAFLGGWSAADTLRVFDGQVSGGTMTGRMRGSDVEVAFARAAAGAR